MLWYLLLAVIVVAVVAYVPWTRLRPKRGQCTNWKAWHNPMPGPGQTPTLFVTGECSFPTAGYAVELRRHDPQGTNPAYLVLEKVVREPSGPLAAAVLTVVRVEYSEETDFKYEFVTILPDKTTLPVEDVF